MDSSPLETRPFLRGRADRSDVVPVSASLLRIYATAPLTLLSRPCVGWAGNISERASLRTRANRPSVRGKIDLTFLMLKSSSPLGLRRLRKTVYFAPVLLLLAVVSLSGVPFAHAQSLGGWTPNGWISSGTVYDLTGNANLTQGQALVTGHDYNMTLKVTVPNTSTSTPQFQVSLNNLLQSAKGQPL